MNQEVKTSESSSEEPATVEVHHPHRTKFLSEGEFKDELVTMGFPERLDVSTAFLSDIDREIKVLFAKILIDYSNRVDRPITESKFHIAICGVDPQKSTKNNHLGCTVDTENRIFIQVEDPYMDLEDPENSHLYIQLKFLEIICHEMVHAAQILTKPTKKRARRYGLKFDKKKENEAYFFDPDEVEARILEAFYAQEYAIPLLIDQDKYVLLP